MISTRRPILGDLMNMETKVENKNEQTGADVLVESLQANGVNSLFGLPGGQLDNFFDAIQRKGKDFSIIRSRHEQGAAYMAFGAARSTGKPSVFSVVPGPGIMNSMGALSTAWAANSPVLSLCGQIGSDQIGSGRGYLHEIPDQLATMRTLLKHAERIDTPHNAPQMINDAFVAMQSGRPGPVHLEMSPDVMGAKTGFVPCRAAPEHHRQCADVNDIDEAIALLKSAKRPLIYVGGGAQDAASQVNALANMIEAPVTCFRSGRGIMDDRDYHAQVFPAGRRLWKDADVVFAIGTRLKYAQLYWGLDEDIKIIRLDIDPKEFGRYAQPAVALHGDAVATLDALLPALEADLDGTPASRERKLTKLKTELHAEMAANVGPQMAYLQAIRDVLPDDGIFCDEITQVGFTSWFGLPIHTQRGHINCGFQGTLGYGFATALGVKVANPDKAVVSVSGDGGFLFTATELATAVEYGINLVTVVFNDNRYANVYRQQKEWYDGRFIAADLHNPDFVKMGEAFGANVAQVNGPDELRAAIEKGLKAKGPTLIEAHQAHNIPAPWQYILEAPVRGPNAA